MSGLSPKLQRRFKTSHPLKGGDAQQPKASFKGVGREAAESQPGRKRRRISLEHGHLVVETVEHLAQLKQIAA